MYNTELKPGLIVDILKDPKDDSSRVECQGLLLEDANVKCTFFLDYEKMYKPEHYSTSFMNYGDLRQIEINNIYEYLHRYLHEPKKGTPIYKFKSDLVDKCSCRIYSYNKIYEVVLNYIIAYEGDNLSSINNVLQIEPKYIVRYIQQTTIKSWNPSLFVLEKWKVKMMNLLDPFYSPFTAYRYIPKLIKISATDEEISSLSNTNYYNEQRLMGYRC